MPVAVIINHTFYCNKNTIYNPNDQYGNSSVYEYVPHGYSLILMLYNGNDNR